MSTNKDKKTEKWSVDFYVYPGGVRTRVRKKGFPRKKDAVEFENSRKADHSDSTALVKKRFSTLTFGEIATQYRDNHLTNGKASGNVTYTNNLVKQFGDHVLSKITTKEVLIYFEKLFSGEIQSSRGKHFELSSIEKHLTYFKTIFNYAITREVIAINPIKNITFLKQFKKKNKRNKSLSQEDFNTFQQMFTKQRWWAKAVISVLWHTGMRIGEVCNLKWEEVDLKSGIIVLEADRVKEGRTRTIGVEKEALDLLKDLNHKNNRKGAKSKDHVFGMTAEDPLHYQTVYKMFRSVVECSEFSEFNIHDIRHSYAIRKRREGWDKEVIKSQMGHTSDSMWNWYNDVAADEVAAMSGYNDDQLKSINSDVENLVNKIKAEGIPLSTVHTVFRNKLRNS